MMRAILLVPAVSSWALLGDADGNPCLQLPEIP
jgi:hypothetical protein